ncbi:MAG: DUF2807 domain-containing protein [Crocinitomicaceae bacterium]
MKSFWFTLFLISILFLSCKKIDASKGEKLDHSVSVGSFNQIVLKFGGILNYTEDSTQHTVTLHTSQAVMDILDVKVENGQLIFGLKDGYTLTHPEDIEISVVSPLCNYFNLSGIGKMNIFRTSDSLLNRCEFIISGNGDANVNKMHATELFSLVSGSGNIRIENINVVNNASVVSGSGDIALYGNTYTNILQVSGVGNINSYSLNSVHANINFSGSASARVRVDSTLNVNISGYGNVFYKGYPAITSSISGDGGVIDSN